MNNGEKVESATRLNRKSSFWDRLPIFGGLSVDEKIIFARHLSIMSNSGMDLLTSLEMLREQTTSKRFGRILKNVIAGISEGQFLSISLEQYRDIFGDLFINIVRVGEASGTFSENLLYLAEELKKKKELRRKIRSALIYPIIILITTFGITGVLTFIVFPKILPIFRSLNVPLPLLTRSMIAASEFLLNYYVLVASGAIILIFSLWFLLRIKIVRFYFNYFLLKIPFLANMIKSANVVNLSMTLGTLLRGGIKIVEALKITADTLVNPIYREELNRIADRVSNGESMSVNLINKARYFPPIFIQMIRVGENTGNLDKSLIYLAEFYESDLDEKTKTLSSILEPLLLLIMGVIVAFVALSIITPIYQVTQTLGR
ncbi:MAG TPA: type II secretion system F family protein [Patescibacteria group bacterium]|nr:type II secretion system F family protein [Patescibacteria group bacterium]